MIETTYTNQGINSDVLFGHGCADKWVALGDGGGVWVQNGTVYPPEPREEARFRVAVNGNKLVLKRLEGSHQVLVDGEFQAD